MDRWVDRQSVAVDGVYYAKYDLRPEIAQVHVDGIATTEPLPPDATENVWYGQDEITVVVPIGIEQHMLCRDEGNETWASGASGEGDYYIPITISRTDEMEKRMVCENVLQVDASTFAIF